MHTLQKRRHVDLVTQFKVQRLNFYFKFLQVLKMVKLRVCACVCVCVCVCVYWLLSHALCDPMEYSPPGSFVLITLSKALNPMSVGKGRGIRENI